MSISAKPSQEHALAEQDAWTSLVNRSAAAWKDLHSTGGINNELTHSLLQSWNTLDDFLDNTGNSLLFWFFQRRSAFMSQKRIQKWSRERLDDYVLSPAVNGYVTREDCFFVSHFWRTRHDPDPDGECLRLLQAELDPQTWSYIWVDWTCMPQDPRISLEEGYFHRSLQTMSGIIRNAGFIYFYPPFEPRLCILYEITEYALTCIESIPPTPDIKQYLEHVKEMQVLGVKATIEKYGYSCSYNRDKQFLISWLELLVLLRRLHLILPVK